MYNPNTLSYERVYPSAKDRFFGVLRHLSIGIVIGVGIFFIFSRTFDSPVESLLKKENKLLQTQYEVLSLRLNNALEVLMTYSNATRTYTGRSSRRNRSPNPSASPVSAGPTGMNT